MSLSKSRGKETLEQLPCERFLQGFEFSRAFLPLVLQRENRGRFQNPAKIAQKAVLFPSRLTNED